MYFGGGQNSAYNNMNVYYTIIFSSKGDEIF